MKRILALFVLAFGLVAACGAPPVAQPPRTPLGYVPPRAGGGWQDSVFSSAGCDFSAIANTTLSPDGPYTLCGVTWTKENSSGDATAMAIVNGQGLKISPGASKDYASLLGIAARTAPILRVPLSSLGLTGLSWASSVRVELETGAETNAAWNPDGTIVAIDDCGTTSDLGSFYLAGAGLYGLNGAAANKRWFAASRRQFGATSVTTATVTAPVATFVLALYSLAQGSGTTVGITYYNPTATIPLAESDMIPVLPIQPNASSTFMTAAVPIGAAPQLPTAVTGLCVVLSAGETGGSDNYVTVIKKVRVQYRL